MYRRVIVSLLAVALIATVTPVATFAHAGSFNFGLWVLRISISRYHNIDRAVAAGYSVVGEPCVSSPDGTMGIHAVNTKILATGRNNLLQPPILLYVPRPNGSLRLVGAEYFTVALANTPNGPAPWFAAEPPPDGFFTPAPRILGRTFDGPMPGHNPQMPWHFDLHAWVIAHNPAGVFAPFNPALSCP